MVFLTVVWQLYDWSTLVNQWFLQQQAGLIDEKRQVAAETAILADHKEYSLLAAMR